MPLTDPVFMLAGLVEIALPTRTVRLCDGGFIDWPAVGLFTSEDEVFGTIESVSSVNENIGDEAPMGELTLLPPDIAAAADLFQPDAQGSPMRFWLAEVNPATGALIGTPDLQSTAFLDTLTLRAGKGSRKVEIAFVHQAERLFWTKEGNVLSPRFHESVWPGEKGLDFVTGVQLAVPWGIGGPGRGTLGIPNSILAAAIRNR